MLATLAEDAPAVMAAISQARRTARGRAWALNGENSAAAGANAEKPLVIDLDATLVKFHSEKENARPTFKRGYAYHPLCAFVDLGRTGTGEPLAMLLRPGNAGSNPPQAGGAPTAADHIAVTKDALAQLPEHLLGSDGRGSKKVLIRTDGAGGTKGYLAWLSGRSLAYSVGFTLPEHTPDLLKHLDEADAWTPAYDSDDDGIRDGAWVAELTGLLDLEDWPEGMRVIVRKERPHPGAQLRITDHDGMRITAFAINTPRGQLPALELRHRRRARCEDRIRNAKDMGLMKFPFQGYAPNQVWTQIIQLAADLVAWMQTIALNSHAARKREPKRLRARLFSIPATLVRRGRAMVLHLAEHAPEAATVLTGVNRLRIAAHQT